MVTTARAMFSTLERLKSMPMSWRDINLQWTQLQRMALDLVAMDSYHGHYLTAMLQRDKVHTVNSMLMGSFTTNPVVVENMFYAGIPVVFVRVDSHPNSWNITTLRITSVFYYPLEVDTEEWYTSGGRRWPCRTLWLASHGMDRIRMSRPFSRYFEDIPSLPSAPALEPGFTFPPPPPPASAPTPQYDNALPDIVFERSASPESHPMAIDDDLPRAATPDVGPSVRPGKRTSLVATGGVQKPSRSQKKKERAGTFLPASSILSPLTPVVCKLCGLRRQHHCPSHKRSPRPSRPLSGPGTNNR